MRIQAQTTLLFTLLTAGIIASLSFSVYYFTSKLAFNDFLKRLELRVVIASKLRFEQDRTSINTYNELKKQHLEMLPDEKEYIVRYDPSSNSFIDSSGLNLSPNFYRNILLKKGATVYTDRNDREYAGKLYSDETGEYLVITSAINLYGNRMLDNLKKVLIASFVIGVLIVFTVGLFFSKKTFEPVRDINLRAQDISAHNLHLRLDVKPGKDEISQLSHTFNMMLDRLQTAFETQNNFVSNASHEFRTPLTTIIGEADLALSKQRTVEEYRQTLEVIIRQAERLQLITGSLLNLAQSGFDGKKQDWKIVRMDELLFEVKESIDKLYPGGKLKLDLSRLPDDNLKLKIMGNSQLVRLAISNVIMNGFKYSDNNIVKVSIFSEKRNICIEIVDTGIGIPADEIKHIYVPFFRASNSTKYEGYGIGLPLTKAIVTLHEGNILVDSRENEGTHVRILLPQAKISRV